MCDPAMINWEEWEGHVSTFDMEKMGRNRAIMIFPTGIASEEAIHGATQIFTPVLQSIRQAFTFRFIYFNFSVKY